MESIPFTAKRNKHMANLLSHPKPLSFHMNGIKCELFRDTVSFAKVICFRLSFPEKLLSKSDPLTIQPSFNGEGIISATFSMRITEQFQTAEVFPHRRNAWIKRKDGNIRLVCSIPVNAGSACRFFWETTRFETEIQLIGNLALIPISPDGHKYL